MVEIFRLCLDTEQHIHITSIFYSRLHRSSTQHVFSLKWCPNKFTKTKDQQPNILRWRVNAFLQSSMLFYLSAMSNPAETRQNPLIWDSRSSDGLSVQNAHIPGVRIHNAAKSFIHFHSVPRLLLLLLGEPAVSIYFSFPHRDTVFSKVELLTL